MRREGSRFTLEAWAIACTRPQLFATFCGRPQWFATVCMPTVRTNSFEAVLNLCEVNWQSRSYIGVCRGAVCRGIFCAAVFRVSTVTELANKSV